MTECDTGDVVLLPFPFTDYSSFKKRPALVVSSREWNNARPDIIVVAISSRIGQSKFEYVLNEQEQKSGGLPVHSAVRLGNLYTVEKGLIRKRIGAFNFMISFRETPPNSSNNFAAWSLFFALQTLIVPSAQR